MESGINLYAVLIANILGITLLLMTSAINFWRLKEHGRESKILVHLIIFSLLACIADPIAYLCDGHEGIWNFIGVYAGSLYIFMSNFLVGPLWVAFICTHLFGKISKRHLIFILSISAIGAVTLIINIFVPIAFSVSADNVYTRGNLYFIYVCFSAFFILDSIFMYILSRFKGGYLKYFPVWVYIIPVIIGIIIQTIFYGVSTVWPSVAIAVSCIFASLQNELIFRDKLTGLYNRFFLDRLKSEIVRKKNTEYTALMLDLNKFKKINDNFGHAMGDDALIQAGRIFEETVGVNGTTIRYAGDEFIILLNTQDEETIVKTISVINQKFDEFNRRNTRPYHLSVAIGYCSLDLKEETIEDLMNEVDKRMYANKKLFHEAEEKNN